MHLFRPASFSDRKFSGLFPWLMAFLLTAILGVGVSSLGGRIADGRMMSPVELVLFYPLARLCIGLMAIAVLARGLRVSVPAVMQSVLPWLLPLQLLPGGVDLLLSLFHVPMPAAFFVNPATVLLPFITLGLLPHPLVSYGALFTIVCVAVMIFVQIKHVRGSTRPAILHAVAFYLITILFLAVPSLIGWLGLSSSTGLLTAGSNTVSRGLIVLSQQGYWWSDVAARFPGTLGGETEVSVLFLLATIMLLLLIVASGYWMRKISRVAWNAWIFEDRGWLLAYACVTLFAGFALALAEGSAWLHQGTMVWAFLLLLLVWTTAFLAIFGAGDLADLADDERMGRLRPLVTGHLSPVILEDLTHLLTGIACIGAWVLGWPIFVCVSVSLLAQYVYRSPFLQGKSTMILSHLLIGFSLLLVWVSGWFFVTQTTTVARLPLPLMIGIGLFFAVHSMLRVWSRQEHVRDPLCQALIEQYGAPRARQILAIGISAAYVIPGLCLWSWFMLAFGAAVGLASFLTLQSNKPHKREIFVLFSLFLFVSVFVLGR